MKPEALISLWLTYHTRRHQDFAMFGQRWHLSWPWCLNKEGLEKKPSTYEVASQPQGRLHDRSVKITFHERFWYAFLIVSFERTYELTKKQFDSFLKSRLIFEILEIINAWIMKPVATKLDSLIYLTNTVVQCMKRRCSHLDRKYLIWVI